MAVVTPLERPQLVNPAPRLEADGRPSALLDEQLLAFDLREDEAGMAALELRLSNFVSTPEGQADFAFEDEAELRLGSRIVLEGGDREAPEELFRGVVTALEAEFPEQGPPELVVLAEDDLQRARMARRSATHRDLSPADLARRLARELGLEARVEGLERPVATWVQLNESDLAFLRRVVTRVGGVLHIVGDRLEAGPRDMLGEERIVLVLHRTLHSARFVADLADQVSEITCSGWDHVAGRRVEAASAVAPGGPGRGRTGAALLEQALGRRSEHLGQAVATSDEEARALADAAFEQRARRFVRVEGCAFGDPALRVGTEVELVGVGPRFENAYRVVATHHYFDRATGYRTDFIAESAFLGEPA